MKYSYMCCVFDICGIVYDTLRGHHVTIQTVVVDCLL